MPEEKPFKKILRSYARYAMYLPPKDGMPGVTIPQGKMMPNQIAKGMIPVLECDRAIWDRIMAEEIIRGDGKTYGYFKDARGEVFKDPKGKVVYQVIDHVPEQFQNSNLRVVRLEQQNAALRNELRKNGIPIPGESPIAFQREKEVPESERADSVSPNVLTEQKIEMTNASMMDEGAL